MKRLALGLVLLALAAITAACSGGASSPASEAPPGPGASAPAGSGLVIVAKDLAFLPTSVTIPADEAVEIILDNQEAAPHNIAIKDASGATVFKGEIVSTAKATNAVPALATGSYTFWCELHPNMQGTITAG